MFGMLKATEVLESDESVVSETSNAYDYRGRRISHIENEDETQYSYGDGVSVLETKDAKTTLFYRGSDQGGGVGGVNYTEYSDGSELNYKIYNLRGDVIKTVDANKQTKSFSNYYAFGEYKDVIGDIKTDDYRANTKVEDDHNLLNEGKRFRQLEYGIFLTPDPLEYVDGYNPYIYCGQNPWGKWDPEGLNAAVVSGGINEDIKKDSTHDLNWKNFTQAAVNNLKNIKEKLKKGEEVEWYVQKSSYEERAKNEGKSADYYTDQIAKMAKDNAVKLNWYNSKDELIEMLNGGEKGRDGLEKISDFQYFGHGVSGTLMTQYNKENLTIGDLKKINKDAFMSGATATSWACNTGTGGIDSFAQNWANRFNHPMRAFIGRSDYTPVAETRNPIIGFLNWYHDYLPIPGKQDYSNADSFWHTYKPENSQP